MGEIVVKMARVLSLCPPMTSAMGTSYIFLTSIMTSISPQILHWSFGRRSIVRDGLQRTR